MQAEGVVNTLNEIKAVDDGEVEELMLSLSSEEILALVLCVEELETVFVSLLNIEIDINEVPVAMFDIVRIVVNDTDVLGVDKILPDSHDVIEVTADGLKLAESEAIPDALFSALPE